MFNRDTVKCCFILVLFYVSVEAYSQCPAVIIEVPASVCLSSYFEPNTTVSNATSFSWDMCDGSLLNTPVTSVDMPVSGIPDPYDLKHIEENGNHYVFVVSYGADRILRFDHGTQLTSIPALADLGNLGITRPLGIGFRKEASGTFALVVTESGKLFRLVFGSSVSSIPVASEITGLTGLTDHRQMKIIEENGSVFALIAGGSTENISILNFGNSISNQPSQQSVSLPSASYLTSVDIIAECGSKYALVSTYGDGLYLLNFGTSFLNTPAITHPVSGGQRLGLSIVKSKGNFSAFVATQSAGIDRVDFGNAMTNAAPSVTSLGVFTGINFAIGHTIVKDGSKYYDLTFNYEGRYRVLQFPKDCPYTDGYEDMLTPDLTQYTVPGSYSVTLQAQNADEEIVSITNTIIVSAQNAPTLTMTESHQCQENAITFSSAAGGGVSITDAEWKFGDMTLPSQDITAIHQYATAGTYEVQLDATFSDGCTNLLQKEVKIYDAPQPAFLMPSGVLCTNNQHTFENITPDNFDGQLTYQWFVDDVLAGTSRDLIHAFTSVQASEIRLKTSIPGCSDETEQTTSGFLPGPVVNFLFTGQCEESPVQFISETSEIVTSHLWNFNDGNTSSDSNPSHTFVNQGTYSVSLTAASPYGCNNSKTKAVPIHTKPVVDFKIDPPPLSCSGYATAFKDLTIDPADSDLQFWQWNFGDTGAGNTASAQNPSHTYSNAGMYTVSLTATTDAGCSALWEEQITISQSPAATIDNSAACKGLPVNFNAIGTAIQSYYWEIGTSYYEVANPIHIFNTPGNYEIYLLATGSNNCQRSVTKTINIPEPLVPDFSVSNNCIGYDAVFTDVTTGNDPVASRQWTIVGVDAGTTPAMAFPFTSTGNKEIRLRVTSAAGCSYTSIKNISVAPAPKAAFTASPETGAAPLTVSFINASTGTATYTWIFSESSGATSNQISPTYIFQELGEHNVELIARSNEGCEVRANKLITIEAPLPDVELKIITVSENADGSLKVIITIQNRGNTILENLPVHIDISGEVSLREIIEERILPSAMHNLVLSYGITQADLKFLCATAELENDLAPEGNRMCTELGESTFIFTAYPNPVKNQLNIEWINHKDRVVSIFLSDAFGRSIIKTEVVSTEGLNRQTFDVNALQTGIYFLVINDGFIRKTQRILVSSKN